ncbi:hypothetical protein N665_0005s0255 [Sinapis alba]|nr:hypothetical protein N665_0005s0255 [Sinapis alba]
MSGDLFRRDRPFNQLDGFYTDWSEHLTINCLPLFRGFSSDAINDAVLHDIRSYYDTLDYYANKDTILYLLFPSWRSNSLETPILFLGDIHPHLFTSLVHSFIDDDALKQDLIYNYNNLAADWSLNLGNTVKETVLRLLGAMRKAHDRFVKRFSDKWVSSFRLSQSETVLMETATSVTMDQDGGGGEIMEEFVRIFRKANQLRKNTITNIAGVLNVNQRALFLESVCKLLAKFKHQDQAFQNSLDGNHLIIQQLPEHDQLFPPPDPSGEVLAHNNYHPCMVEQYAPHLPPQGPLFPPFAPSGEGFAHHNYHPYMMQQYGSQRLPPNQRYPPSWEVIIAHQNFHPHMMHQYAPRRPPPPMNQHQKHTLEQNHVIYVGNLAPEATEDLLLQMFRGYRSVRESKIRCDKGGNAYGFVSFADERDKMKAMKQMNRGIFLDRPMNIRHAAKNSI